MSQIFLQGVQARYHGMVIYSFCVHTKLKASACETYIWLSCDRHMQSFEYLTRVGFRMTSDGSTERGYLGGTELPFRGCIYMVKDGRGITHGTAATSFWATFMGPGFT